MSTALTIVPEVDPCWQQIGVWGDRSCTELAKVIHCHNCPVFAAAGRRFLDAPSPNDYLDEWTTRLGSPDDDEVGEEISVLVFRLSDEWLALPVSVLVEVTPLRAVHRIPHRGGLLSGMVNIRGELHLCIRLDLFLGVGRSDDLAANVNPRLIVIRQELEGWVFAADEVDQVHRVSAQNLVPAAPTLSRATAKMNKGVFHLHGKSVGLLDESKVFQSLRERTR
jgi:chemotaxis-related protein WspD